MIHETACVDTGAQVGKGTKIWHFCHVRSSAVIGRDCSLGQNVYIDADVRLGDRVKIQNNVSVYTGVTLEDDVFLGPSCVFTNVSHPRSAYPTPAAGYARTLVGRGATVGANATVVCGVTIGPWAFVAAGAVVTKDVLAHEMVMGVPARRTGWVCMCGQALRFRLVPGRRLCTCGRKFAIDEGACRLTSGGPS